MGEWQNGLFGCFNNIGICVITYFVPCLTAGQNAEKVGKNCLLYGCLTLLGPIGIWSRATVRGLIRESKGIEGSFLMDCVLHWICAVCALVQEAQELGGGGQAESQAESQAQSQAQSMGESMARE